MHPTIACSAKLLRPHLPLSVFQFSFSPRHLVLQYELIERSRFGHGGRGNHFGMGCGEACSLLSGSMALLKARTCIDRIQSSIECSSTKSILFNHAIEWIADHASLVHHIHLSLAISSRLAKSRRSYQVGLIHTRCQLSSCANTTYRRSFTWIRALSVVLPW